MDTPEETVISLLLTPTFSRHQLRRRGSSERSGPLGDQPFPGLLQLENLSREGLVDVLRAAVVDQKGEAGRGSCTETWEGSLPLRAFWGLTGLPTKALGAHILVLPPTSGMTWNQPLNLSLSIMGIGV